MGTRADLDDVRARLGELRAWADGYEETNETRARSIRSLVYDVGEYLDAYEEEARGRVAMQANYDRALDVIGSRLYAAAIAADADVHAFARLGLRGVRPDVPDEANPFL